MDVSAFIITVAVLAHCFGFLFFLAFNPIYQACTRGPDSARGHGSWFKCKNRNFKRLYKLRFHKAYNLLVLYHAVLAILGVIVAVLCDAFEDVNYQIDSYHDVWFMCWISAIINWAVVFQMVFTYAFVAVIKLDRGASMPRRSYIFGHLNQYNIYGFLNSVVFWASALLLLTCLGADCANVPEPWKTLAEGPWAGAAMGISYALMLPEALYAVYSVAVDEEVISKQEAVDKLTEKIEQPTFIEWLVECGFVVQQGKNSEFVVWDSETRKWETETTNTVTRNGRPYKGLFSRSITHLTILYTIRPADKETHLDMVRLREEFLESHKGHSETERITTKNHFEENYFVSDKDCIPFYLRKRWLLVAAVLGLSIPYRILVWSFIGHVRFKIRSSASVRTSNEKVLNKF